MDFDKELERVAREYRDEGYAVITHPDADHLPGFAAGFDVDLLAERGDERVLVQVKRNRAELQTDPKPSQLAEATNAQPGWRYDLVVLEPDSPLERIARRAGEPTQEQIEQMLGEAEQLTQGGAVRAGLVLAWAGLEAAMRRFAGRVGVNGGVGTPPHTMIRELYAQGHLSREDFDRLEESRRLRTEVVHGLAPPAISAGTVQTVIGMAQRFLTEREKVQAVAG